MLKRECRENFQITVATYWTRALKYTPSTLSHFFLARC